MIRSICSICPSYQLSWFQVLQGEGMHFTLKILTKKDKLRWKITHTKIYNPSYDGKAWHSYHIMTNDKTQDAKYNSQNTIRKKQDAKCKSQDAKCKSQDAKCKSQDAKCKSQDSRCKSQNARCKIQVTKRKIQNAKYKSQNACRFRNSIEAGAQWQLLFAYCFFFSNCFWVIAFAKWFLLIDFCSLLFFLLISLCFFSVTYMTEISLIVTLNNQFTSPHSFMLFAIRSYISIDNNVKFHIIGSWLYDIRCPKRNDT